MAKEIYRLVGSNTSVISAGADADARYSGRMRVRLTQQELALYGHFSRLRIVNKSSKKVRIHYEPTVEASNYDDLEGNNIYNLDYEDGKKFPGFDVENLDTTDDIAVGDIQYFAAVVVD